MNRYQTETPRAAFGIAALALTALTIALFVVAPATTGSGTQDGVTLAASRAITPVVTEVAIIPGRIDVIGVREPNVAIEAPPANVARNGHQG